MQYIHKHLIGSLLLLVLASANLMAQTDSTSNPSNSGKKGIFKKGSMEFTLAGTGGSFSESRSGSSSSSSSSSTTLIDISFMPAYYIIDGLSIEPEIGLSIIAPSSGTSSTAYSLVGNLAYTFAPSGSSSVAPYVRAGYGISNGVQIPTKSGEFLIELNEDSKSGYSTVSILNLGVGIKSVIGGHAAIRTELFYKKQSYSFSYSGASIDYSDGMIGIQFGISLLP